jgi:cysteinyl-tRNA synthetase
LMYFCEAHYRQPMEFDEQRLAGARARASRIRDTARGLTDEPSPPWSSPLRERFFDALAADFNTPRALAVVSEWVREANRSAPASVGAADLHAMLDVLGLASLMQSEGGPAPAAAVALSDARERARARGDYTEADRLRDQLASLGWEVRDGPGGPELLPGESAEAD